MEVTGIALPLALFLIMLSMGMTLERGDFERVGKQRKAFLIGMASQMLLPPAIAVCLAVAFALPPEFAVGLLILSFCPSGTISNLFSYLCRADVALSISLTAAASVITPFTIPLLTEALLAWQLGAERQVAFPVVKTMFQLAAVVLLPVMLGMLWRKSYRLTCRRWQPRLQRISVGLFTLVVVAIVVDLGADLSAHLADAGAVCMALVLSAMLLGYLDARHAGLDQRQVRTISIEVGMQHGGMALVVTQGVLMNSTMSVVPVTYGLLMLIPAVLMAINTRINAQREPIV